MTNNAPTHEVFVVKDRGEGQKAWWTKVGSAWTCKDGSLNVQLDALPIDGKLNIRVHKPRS